MMKKMPPSATSASKLNDADVTDARDMKSSQEPLHMESSQQNKCTVKGFLKRNAFVLLTIAAILIGLGLGFALRSTNMTARDKKYFTFPGELLLRMLQCLVLPLITSSVITGLSSIKSRSPGRVGLWAFCYYATTSVMAVFTGIVIVVLIKPGKTLGSTSAPPGGGGEKEAMPTVDAFLDLIRNTFPSNLVVACFEQYKTVYSKNTSLGKVNLTQTSDLNDQMPMPGSIEGVNILGLITLSIAFGLVLGRMENEGKPLRDFFRCLNEASMHLISIAIWYTPVGILFLVGGQILQVTNIGEIGRQLGMYTVTVILGLAIHSLVTLPIIYIAVTRKNPFRFLAGILNALTTALGTSSSLVTLPVTIRCLEDNLNMDQRVTRVVLPIASTLTLEGTALYEAVAAIFIAQVHNVDLGVAEIVIISITATVAAIGGSGIPQAGMVTMALVLTSVGLPFEGITYIIAVDWILDRLRTVTNVIGDSVGVAIVHHLSRHDFEDSKPMEEHLVGDNKETPSNSGSN